MNDTLVKAFTQELATVVGAMTGETPTVAPAAAPVSGDGWTVTIDTDAPVRGSWILAIDAGAARALTAAIMGLTGEVPPTSIPECLRETIGQVTSALSLQDVACGVALRAGDVVTDAAIATTEPCTSIAITCGALTVTVSVSGEINVTVAAPQARASGTGSERKAPAGVPAAAESDRLDAILDIELPLVVRFGRTELPLRTLAQLGPGSLIDLGRSADDPVDLLVSNRVVARGEVVVVGGNYGVRVLDVVSARDRARPMEA